MAEKKTEHWIKGTFTSNWDEGMLESEAEMCEETGELRIKDSGCDADLGFLLSETFTTEDDEEYEVCPICHEYVMKVVVVPDNVGNGLHEEMECPAGCRED